MGGAKPHRSSDPLEARRCCGRCAGPVICADPSPWNFSRRGPCHPRGDRLCTLSIWQVALARRREKSPGGSSAPAPPAALPTHRGQVTAIVSNDRLKRLSQTTERAFGVKAVARPAAWRERSGWRGGRDPMRKFSGGGQVPLANGETANTVTARMAWTPPDNFSAGGARSDRTRVATVTPPRSRNVTNDETHNRIAGRRWGRVI